MAVEFGVLGIEIVAKLIEATAGEDIRLLFDAWGKQSRLDELRDTVSHIKRMFDDINAQAQPNRCNQEQDYIEKLQAAVYDAEDLFDELVTDAEQNKLNSKEGGKFSVKHLFSKKPKVAQAYSMSGKIKEIKKRIDDAVNNHTAISLTGHYTHMNRLGKSVEETHSCFDKEVIVGRVKEKEEIVYKLLNQDTTLFLTIVGVGGVGKTTLAQLVFDDEQIKQEFEDRRLWVFVSNPDGDEQFDVKAILCRILELLTNQNHKPDTSSSIERLQKHCRKETGGKNYFLVLDDVWNENREKWEKLTILLKEMVQCGSKIVVTTRSEITADIIDRTHVCKLKELHQEDSLAMFKKLAIKNGYAQQMSDESFVKSGEKIVEKCYGNPHTIKRVANFLFDKDITKWQPLLEKYALADMGEGNENVLSRFMRSYHSLDYSIKRCFSYCAMFTKDSKIEKEMLIGLWMAQGYIVPNEVQSLEDVANEYLSLLSRRFFFQEEGKKENDVEFVKIHNLMLEVAQKVGRKEISVVTSKSDKLSSNIRHVHYVDDECPNSCQFGKKIRSYFCYKYNNNGYIENWLRLRVLDVSCSDFESLTDSITRLRLLRYLNLSSNSGLKKLTESVTQLHNLQTLLLRDCKTLSDLPKDFGKLKNLRLLDLRGCDELQGMPSGINGQKVRTLADSNKTGDQALKKSKSLTKIKSHIVSRPVQVKRKWKAWMRRKQGI